MMKTEEKRKNPMKSRLQIFDNLKVFQRFWGWLFKRYRKPIIAFEILAAAFFISANWYQILLIHGDSMYPAYHDMQFVILDKHLGKYTYGDVVAFWCAGLDTLLVKRIAACPGDQVWIQDEKLFVNGRESQVFPADAVFADAGLAKSALFLGKDEYFVIGDQIAKSKDSRFREVGYVREADIRGKVLPEKNPSFRGGK